MDTKVQIKKGNKSPNRNWKKLNEALKKKAIPKTTM